MAVCAQCHVGLTKFADPTGDDLLVANQVEAIQRSECFLQSGKAFSCTTCHDPHQDATDDKQAEKVCLGCHTAEVKSHAANGCVGCHMPSVEMGALHLVDHLIRVHPEQKSGLVFKSKATPVSAYVRVIVTKTEADAARARERIGAGESFYDVAREMSIDPSAAIGGYLGRLKWTPPDDPKVIYERMPRDFKWQAEQLLNAGKAREALKVYPHYLKALNYLGVESQRADVLRLAAKLYPEDAGTRFALAAVLEARGQTAEAANIYGQTIALEKDFTAAYVRLGMIEYQAGNRRLAVETFQQGLQIDPLSDDLRYGLGLAEKLP
jgi:predicted CXXCH cytochrome family protein